jgi:hypothetical protein
MMCNVTEMFDELFVWLKFLFWTVMSLLGTTVLVLVLSGCSTVNGLVKPSGGLACDKIVYYDSYIESAQRAIVILQFVPGTANYLGAASSALLLADTALDDAKKLCDLYDSGASTTAQLQAAFDTVYHAISGFNESYGKIKLIVKSQ